MKKLSLISILLILLLSSLTIIHFNESSPYSNYRNWYDKEIAYEMDQALKKINKKIERKKIQTEDYVKLAGTYETLYKKALDKKELHATHKHLLLYLESRVDYHQRYMEYFNDKDQLIKAELNNIYEKGNIERQLFLDELENYAKENKEIFNYPLGLY